MTVDYDLGLFRKSCKAQKCTVNQALHAVLGQTVRLYSIARGDEVKDGITVSFAMALRPVATRREDLVLGNALMSPFVPLACESLLDVAIKKAKRNSVNIVGTFDLLAASTVLDIILRLPYNIQNIYTKSL